MKRIIPLTVMLMAVALTMSSCTSEKVNIEAEKAEISKIIDAYCKTINDDDLELVNQIWSHGDEVSFIAPSGRYSSYNEIRDNFVHGVFGVNFTKRNLQKEELIMAMQPGQSSTGCLMPQETMAHLTTPKAVSHNSSTRKTANGSWFTSIIPVGIADYFCISFFLFVLKVLHLCKH